MRSWFVTCAAVTALGGALAAALACGPEPDLLQGDEYLPDGTLPIAPASERLDGATRDGSAGDGGGEEAPVPLADGSTAPLNTCETARDIGALSGDKGSGTLTATGSCSEWLSLRVTEDDSSALGAAMKVRLTLTPSGADFDLFAFVDATRDRVVCDAPTASSTKSGTSVEEIPLTWGEGTIANGNDDSRTVGVAVVRAGSPCAADAGSYTLLVEGNR
ncbi:MAG: hypothetical protein KF782_31955 [Labilithrix sp.]|nr:hypothetical protein [Labilithrix sp.]